MHCDGPVLVITGIVARDIEVGRGEFAEIRFARDRFPPEITESTA
jgi:hypothetical protein